MKNTNKILSMAVAASLITTITAAAFAGAPYPAGPYNSPTVASEEAVRPIFQSFTGTVKEVLNDNFVLLENEDGLQSNFYINDDTYFITEDKIEVGAVVTGYFDTNKPALMIYPPQHTAVAIAVNLSNEYSVKVDRFDNEFLSYDNELKLNITDDTEIILQNGDKFEGELADRKLVVTYSMATKSIPAQASPIKVVVLYEEILAPIGILPEVEPEAEDNTGDYPDSVWIAELNAEEMPILVNNKEIVAPNAYTTEDGVFMVPLRAIAEALGFTVSWDEESSSVVLDRGITLSIGKDYYVYQRTAPIELGTAPQLKNSHTYVPVSFFTKVARVGEAYVFEGMIHVNNDGGEMMEAPLDLIG